MYSEDAIIVQEVPMILSVAPNGIYCTTVATTANGPSQFVPPETATGASNASSTPTSTDPASPYFVSYTDEQVEQFVKAQIEYYFSDENLEYDIFLRRKMDPQGYIPLNVIANFNRVRSLSLNERLIVDACKSSQILELKSK